MEPVFNLEKKSIIIPILIHLGFGLLVYFIPVATFYWQLLVIGYGSFRILQSQDKNDEGAIWAAYLAGMEVFYRMTGQSVFWELGKYGVVLFLLLGLAVRNRKIRYTYGLYFLLLLPSTLMANYIDFGQARDMLSFSLSGPLCLAVSGLYFYKQVVSGLTLKVLIRALIMPVLAMVSYLFLETPDFSSIAFGSESNFSTSGGYGPNQVSLVLGVCIFFIIILRFYSISFSGLKWFDYVLIGILVFRALITFSRGGVFGAAVALAAFLVLNFAGNFGTKRAGKLMVVTMVIIAGGFLVWNYTNTLTDDTLTYRYAGINKLTGKEEEYTTGRVLILERDILIFQQNMLMGIGPGKSKLEIENTKGKEIASHTEWSRLLAEHGLLGLMAIGLLLFVPVSHILSIHTSSRSLLIAILILSIFSMFHAAMRLAIIGYLYGWALIIPVGKKNTLRRQ